jgi:hypothetical protein
MKNKISFGWLYANGKLHNKEKYVTAYMMLFGFNEYKKQIFGEK